MSGSLHSTGVAGAEHTVSNCSLLRASGLGTETLLGLGREDAVSAEPWAATPLFLGSAAGIMGFRADSFLRTGHEPRSQDSRGHTYCPWSCQLSRGPQQGLRSTVATFLQDCTEMHSSVQECILCPSMRFQAGFLPL